MLFSNVNGNIEVGNFSLPELPRVLITTILKFCFSIFDCCLKALANHIFFFTIFSVVFKKPSRFSIESLFKMRLGVIFCCYLASNISLVSSIGLGNIRDKEVPRYIQNPRKNVMESYIMSSKTPCFFIQGQTTIMGCCPNFAMSKGARLLV